MKHRCLPLSALRFIHFIAFTIWGVALIVISGCNLPECVNGDQVCVYQVYQNEECLASCQTDAQGICADN